ncbi:uncharacterized protein G2W53_019030 [Senna tora]|uniref:Uncharacterized protein n=1 Tax=Senna tora TaxID=362788 RepID=A0A834TWA2_9FABA|nr:uncharacterized protein G2W53_019030 [Senna tora]
MSETVSRERHSNVTSMILASLSLAALLATRDTPTSTQFYPSGLHLIHLN